MTVSDSTSNLTTPDQPRNIVIIGAGISGLTAAYELQEMAKADGRTLNVTILESQSRIGGAFGTTHVDGFMCEGGADSFITNKPWALQLCHRLGLSDQLMETDERHRRSFVLRKGKLLPVPEGFVLMSPNRVWPILTTPILSIRAKLRMMLEPFIPKNKTNQDESLASFVRRRLGKEVLDRLVQPLVGGIYTSDPETLSLRSTMPQFIEMEQKHGSLLKAGLSKPKKADGGSINKTSSGARYGLFVTLKNGMSTLLEALKDALPPGTIRLNTPVRSVTKNAETKGWVVELQDGSTIQADGVVLATVGHAAASMIETDDARLAELLRSIPYASSAIALVGFNRDQVKHPLDAFGMVVPALENRKILAISFTSVKLPGRAPEGKVLLRVFVGGAMQPELFDLSDEAIKKIVLEETADILGTEGQPCLYQLARHTRAMPQYTIGHEDRVQKIEEHMAGIRGLALASNALHGVGVPDCVRTAQQAAGKIYDEVFGRVPENHLN